MKKLLAIAAFSFLLMTATQASATDLQVLEPSDGAALGFTPSNKVVLYYGSDAGSNNQTYAAMAKHSGGDRLFGTTTQTNLLVSPDSDECPGLNAVDCAGKINSDLELNIADGTNNIDGLSTDWKVL